MPSVNKEKIKNFITSPFGIGTLLTILIFIVLILFVFLPRINSPDTENNYVNKTEIDPASGDVIVFNEITNGDNGDNRPIIVGVDFLFNKGISKDQIICLEDTLKAYLGEAKYQEIYRISYLKDSYKMPAPYIFTFKIVLNIDESTFGVAIERENVKLYDQPSNDEIFASSCTNNSPK